MKLATAQLPCSWTIWDRLWRAHSVMHSMKLFVVSSWNAANQSLFGTQRQTVRYLLLQEEYMATSTKGNRRGLRKWTWRMHLSGMLMLKVGRSNLQMCKSALPFSSLLLISSWLSNLCYRSRILMSQSLQLQHWWDCLFQMMYAACMRKFQP